jgi:methanogenic corrinoid protein MtbC1
MNAMFASLSERFLSAQLAGDRERALRVVLDEGVLTGIPVADLHLKVIRPAQYEIGRLWQDNRISVADEHMATAIAQLAVAHLYRHLDRRREPGLGRRVTVSCVEGETHELGPRMVSDILETHGFRVRYLGADVPTPALVQAVESESPEAVLLSATMPGQLAALREAAEAIRARMPGPRPLVGVGGQAVHGVSPGRLPPWVWMCPNEPNSLPDELSARLSPGPVDKNKPAHEAALPDVSA